MSVRLPDAPPQYQQANEAEARRTLEAQLYAALQRIADLEARVTALGG